MDLSGGHKWICTVKAGAPARYGQPLGPGFQHALIPEPWVYHTLLHPPASKIVANILIFLN